MPHPLDPDFGATAADYAAHRAGFPASFYARLAERGIGAPGQRVVDLGTGTGTLARGFALRGCRVIGIDPKEAMLAQARRLDEAAGVAVTYRCGTAEETGLPAASADVVTAGQCWHWFDRGRAAREVARLLDPRGHLVIAHFDWLPLRGNVAEATERLIAAHNPAWTMGGGHGLHPEWLPELGNARFGDLASFSFDETVAYTPEGWRGRIRASAGVGASLPPPAVAAFDAELAALLARGFPGAMIEVPHRVFVVLGTPPSREP